MEDGNQGRIQRGIALFLLKAGEFVSEEGCIGGGAGVFIEDIEGSFFGTGLREIFMTGGFFDQKRQSDSVGGVRDIAGLIRLILDERDVPQGAAASCLGLEGAFGAKQEKLAAVGILRTAGIEEQADASDGVGIFCTAHEGFDVIHVLDDRRLRGGGCRG